MSAASQAWPAPQTTVQATAEQERPAGSRRRPVSADRVGLPLGWLMAATATSAMTLGVAAASVPSPERGASTLFAMGAGSAALGMLALRSLPIQRVARTQAVVAAMLASRLGVMSGGSAGTAVLGWLAVASSSLIVASYIEHRRRPVLSGARSGGWFAVSAGLIGMALAGAALAGPTVASGIQAGVSLGSLGANPAQPLSRTDAIDMSNRPDLGDDVLFSVRADRPAFWRTATLDRWDSRGWSREQATLYTLEPDGSVRSSPDDLAVASGDLVVQDVRIESDGALALPAAASAVSVESAQPVGQYVDGTLAAASPFGRGATYRVTSRIPSPSPEELRATSSEAVPDGIARTWAPRPTSSDRTKALARTLEAQGAGTYDRVRAIERWLGDNTRYSLDAPLTPPQRDVVDHFLFESKLGWCEQVASSMTVLLREMGIPARVAVGFVPGEIDPLTGRYLVRANDAHSWTEVWFPRFGWVPFDPTAGVPQAGDIPKESNRDGWVDALAGAALLVGGLLTVLPVLRLLFNRLLDRRRRRRSESIAPPRRRLPTSFVELERWLEATGERAGARRAPAETTSSYARRLAAHGVGDPAGRVGALLDEVRYDPSHDEGGGDSRLDELLVQVGGADPPAARR